MSKVTKNKSSLREKKSEKSKSSSPLSLGKSNSDRYLFQMSYAPNINESSGLVQMIPIIFFTAIVIMLTRLAFYSRPMHQFFWSIGDNSLTDIFSYYKMVAILICGLSAFIFVLYRVFIQAFCVKRSYAYIPMLVYTVFVLFSYIFSDYKLFALWGWNERFEGTLVLLSYMAMLFYVINTINSEKNVRWLIYALAASSTVLGFLGLSQALDNDFFRTTIGKKLITPRSFWQNIGDLNFTFQNREIYQTVYNINYVSFYLTLLIPLFGLLFVRSVNLKNAEPLYKKLMWGSLFALLLYNLIGSASSSGLMGMAVVVFVAIIVLNKRILQWHRPVIILLLITLVIGGVSYQRWMPELSRAILGVTSSSLPGDVTEKEERHKLDYIETVGNDIMLGYNEEQIIFTTYPDDPNAISIFDPSGKNIPTIRSTKDPQSFQINDDRYQWIAVKPAQDDNGNRYVVLITDEQEWPFMITAEGPKYLTGTGKLIALNRVSSIGFEDNGSWGNGRGYIWSRSIPILKDTIVWGHGADTFCIYFPHSDYVGKYNSDSYTDVIDIIVDKPHNLYLGVSIGTGVLSLLALLVLWGLYIIQSLLLYSKRSYDSFITYAGAGIFLGICGFLVAALVNDSSVSVMPMFYGLLGTGISINMMLQNSPERLGQIQ